MQKFAKMDKICDLRLDLENMEKYRKKHAIPSFFDGYKMGFYFHPLCIMFMQYTRLTLAPAFQRSSREPSALGMIPWTVDKQGFTFIYCFLCACIE